MNERIRELSKQAWEYARECVADCKFYGYYMEHNELQLQFESKFAELIVKECAEVCYHHSKAAGGADTEFGYGYKDCGDDVKRLFGDEE